MDTCYKSLDSYLVLYRIKLDFYLLLFCVQLISLYRNSGRTEVSEWFQNLISSIVSHLLKRFVYLWLQSFIDAAWTVAYFTLECAGVVKGYFLLILSISINCLRFYITPFLELFFCFYYVNSIRQYGIEKEVIVS